MRYVAISSFLPRVNNTLEPPSPESHEHPVESGSPALDSSPAKPHSSPGPPMIPGVDLPDPKPTSENPASPEGNHRTIGDWFRTVMTKRSHNRTSRQTPSDASPQSGIPSQAEASPPNERPSTMSPAKRQRVCPFSVDIEARISDHLAQRTVGRSTVKRKARSSVLSVYEHHYLLCCSEENSPKTRCVKSTAQDHSTHRSWSRQCSRRNES
jgi:hypothetical protein